MVAERNCKNLCSIVDMVATITVNIKKAWAVVLAHSCFQPRFTSSQECAGVHQHAYEVGPWDVVILKKLHQQLFQLESANLQDL